MGRETLASYFETQMPKLPNFPSALEQMCTLVLKPLAFTGGSEIAGE